MEIDIKAHICYSCGETSPEELSPAPPDGNRAFGDCHNCGAETVVTLAQLLDLYANARHEQGNW